MTALASREKLKTSDALLDDSALFWQYVNGETRLSLRDIDSVVKTMRMKKVDGSRQPR